MSEAGLSAMRSPACVSPVSVWELAHKARRGQLPPLPTSHGSFTRHLAELGFRIEPFQGEDAEAGAALPPLHKDPMDRMLIGTALRARMTIVTCDAIFARYGVETVW